MRTCDFTYPPRAMLTRRGFVVGAAASASMCSLKALAADAKPNLRVGILSDLHMSRNAAVPFHIYYPLMTKEEYTRRVMNEVKDNFFGGSSSSLLKFFVREEKLTEEEIEELIQMVKLANE